uniref:Uncharacterized protein n=1 Tax=viral metagenome TaxID=1070528 RepID=A0A6C0BJQ5_9ZZZZ
MSSNPVIYRYYHEYDDYDRYFDLIYDMYQEMCTTGDQFAMQMTSTHSFSDFYDLCLKKMNRRVVDTVILSETLQQLEHDLGSTVYQRVYNTRNEDDENS